MAEVAMELASFWLAMTAMLAMYVSGGKDWTRRP